MLLLLLFLPQAHPEDQFQSIRHHIAKQATSIFWFSLQMMYSLELFFLKKCEAIIYWSGEHIHDVILKSQTYVCLDSIICCLVSCLFHAGSNDCHWNFMYLHCWYTLLILTVVVLQKYKQINRRVVASWPERGLLPWCCSYPRAAWPQKCHDMWYCIGLKPTCCLNSNMIERSGQAVDTTAATTGGWQPMLQCRDKALIHILSFLHRMTLVTWFCSWWRKTNRGCCASSPWLFATACSFVCQQTFVQNQDILSLEVCKVCAWKQASCRSGSFSSV